jgi:beta-N-acetylhexosaminidase
MHRIMYFLAALYLLSSCRTGLPLREAEAPPPAAPESTDSSRLPLPALTPLDPFLEPVRPQAAEERVETLLASLTLEQKIGQRLIITVGGTRLGRSASAAIAAGRVGGVILNRGNIADREQLQALTGAITAAGRQGAGLVPFIGIDQEGGRVNRLELRNISRFPAPFYWRQLQDPFYVEALAYVTSREIAALGINMNFAPVLDLYGRADDSVIGDRSMGEDPWLVGRLGAYYLRGARRAGVISVVKHFPGHGRTTVNSHFRLPVLEADEDTLLEHDLLPFRLAIEQGGEAVMTAHILYPRIDPDFPVTLSATFIRGILRGQLGYEGVVISDDIMMGALEANFSLEEILRESIRAGVDLILVLGEGPADPEELTDLLLDLYERGRISLAEIEEGVRRILRLKLKYGLIP